jgi:precorrin-2/cobalt-factor-2 C20-methyltransferase
VVEAGLLSRAIYVERGTMGAEVVLPLADTCPDSPAPYFSVILIPGQRRRP